MIVTAEFLAALTGLPAPFSEPVPAWLPPEGGSEPDEEDAS